MIDRLLFRTHRLSLQHHESIIKPHTTKDAIITPSSRMLFVRLRLEGENELTDAQITPHLPRDDYVNYIDATQILLAICFVKFSECCAIIKYFNTILVVCDKCQIYCQ